jgi:hypothetical protein
MRSSVVILAVLVLEGLAPGAAAAQTGVACPVTKPADDSTADRKPFGVWRHGTDAFGVFLPPDGRWHGMAAEQHFRNKVFWYRAGYDGRIEPRPNLVVHGRRLDGSAPPVLISQATNAHHEDFGGWSMLTMVEFPDAGCWELTGQYGRDSVSFVVRVDR